MPLGRSTILLAAALAGCATTPAWPPQIERLPEGAAGPIAPAKAGPVTLDEVAGMARSTAQRPSPPPGYYGYPYDYAPYYPYGYVQPYWGYTYVPWYPRSGFYFGFGRRW
jgi:hypothetical protein